MLRGVKCPMCKGTNISFQIVAEGAKTSKRGNGLLGHTYNAARGVAGIATLGLSNIVLPKAKGHEKTRIKNETYAICQNCVHAWRT